MSELKGHCNSYGILGAFCAVSFTFQICSNCNAKFGQTDRCRRQLDTDQIKRRSLYTICIRFTAMVSHDRTDRWSSDLCLCSLCTSITTGQHNSSSTLRRCCCNRCLWTLHGIRCILCLPTTLYAIHGIRSVRSDGRQHILVLSGLVSKQCVPSGRRQDDCRFPTGSTLMSPFPVSCCKRCQTG